MAQIPATLFFQRNREYRIGSISFDLILSEDHALNNKITEYNIEDGSIITDNVRNEPEQGSLTVLITNFSIEAGELSSNRAQDAFIEFKKLWRSKQRVDLYTIYEVYKNVIITGMNMPRDDQTGESIVVNFGFRKLNIVQLQSVQVFATLNVIEQQKDHGRQTERPAQRNLEVSGLPQLR